MEHVIQNEWNEQYLLYELKGERETGVTKTWIDS